MARPHAALLVLEDVPILVGHDDQQRLVGILDHAALHSLKATAASSFSMLPSVDCIFRSSFKAPMALRTASTSALLGGAGGVFGRSSSLAFTSRWTSAQDSVTWGSVTLAISCLSRFTPSQTVPSSEPAPGSAWAFLDVPSS
jgi:hypothetical protein